MKCYGAALESIWGEAGRGTVLLSGALETVWGLTRRGSSESIRRVLEKMRSKLLILLYKKSSFQVKLIISNNFFLAGTQGFEFFSWSRLPIRANSSTHSRIITGTASTLVTISTTGT